ncbi:hypothetical protein [Moorena sp. SIO4G3]|nr:hypothetical protein [Moorena sp. SIO4G3]
MAVGQATRSHSQIILCYLLPVTYSLFPKKNANANIFFLNFTLAI